MLLKLKTTARVSEVADTADRLLKRYQLASEISNDTFLKTLFGKINDKYQRISEAINRGNFLYVQGDFIGFLKTLFTML